MEQKMKKLNNKISVVIRTKNEERWIGHCIQSVLDQLSKPEIIIVDDDSKDETLHIVRHFIQDPLVDNSENRNYTNIKIFKFNDYTPGKALNFGAAKAKYPVVLIISAHCVLKKINLKKHMMDIQDHVCIFGNQIPKWKGKKITKRYLWSHFSSKSKKNMFSNFENRYFILKRFLSNQEFLINN